MLSVLRQYHGDSLYLAAFAVSIVLLVLRDKKEKLSGSRVGIKAAVAVLLALILVFNGIAYRIAGKLTDTTTYYRFFWMLPVLLLIAYQLTEAFTSKQKTRILLGGVSLILCLAVGANFFIRRENVNRPQNIYGLAPDTLAVADEIMKDWGTERKDMPVAAFDMYLEYQVRTYEPRICWGISRQAYLYQAEYGYDGVHYPLQQEVIAAVNEGICKDAGKLKRCLRKLGIHYLVIQTAFDMNDYLAQASVTPIAQSDLYTIYKVKQKRNKK